MGGRSFQFRALPFGIATAPLEFTRIAREVKLLLQNRGIRIHQYLDDWLLRAPTQQICMEQSKQLVAFIQELGWVINFKKSELIPTQNFDFLGYRFDLVKGEVLPTQKKWLILTTAIESLDNSLNNNSQDPDVIHRHSGISGENSPNGQITHETLPMVSQNSLEVSPIIGQKNTMFRNFEKTSDMVEKPQKCAERLSPSCRRTQSPVVYRCFGQGLGCSFGRPDSQWTVVRHRGKFAYKHSGIEGSVFWQ